ncbi:MAG: diacylglycerol kinase family lipid kinase [Planctomycetes bacterium]|nr:diacylglycerol kinase family lipid kinase [Planctomycetota bacterium]
MASRITAIVNQVSGRRPVLSTVREIARLVQDCGAHFEVVTTQGCGHATDLAAQLPSDCDAVLVVGGDGTVSEVINGLAGRRTPVVILRTGTANLLARTLAMPTDASRIAETLLRGSPYHCDVGIVNGERFIAVVGVGFDAECVQRLAQTRRGHVGYADYFWPIWRSFWEHRFPPLQIDVDGEMLFEGRGLAMVSLIKTYGGRLHLFPEAQVDDGLLDLLIFSCKSRWELAAHAVWAILRRHIGRPGVIYRQCRSVHIKSTEIVPVQVDGNVGGTLPVECSVLPAATCFLGLPSQGPD